MGETESDDVCTADLGIDIGYRTEEENDENVDTAIPTATPSKSAADENPSVAPVGVFDDTEPNLNAALAPEISNSRGGATIYSALAGILGIIGVAMIVRLILRKPRMQ